MASCDTRTVKVGHEFPYEGLLVSQRHSVDLFPEWKDRVPEGISAQFYLRGRCCTAV